MLRAVENLYLLFGSIYELNKAGEEEENPEDKLFSTMLHYYVELLYNFFIDCLCMFSDDFIIDFRFDDKCDRWSFFSL